jgi:hypothetical protein
MSNDYIETGQPKQLAPRDREGIDDADVCESGSIEALKARAHCQLCGQFMPTKREELGVFVCSRCVTQSAKRQDCDECS